MKNRKRLLLFSTGAVILILLGVAAWLYMAVNSRVCGGEAYTLLIDGDDSLDSVQTKLQANAIGWSLLNRVRPIAHLRTGRYVITPDDRLLGTYRRIRNHHQDPVKLRVPDMRLVSQLPSRLCKHLMMDSLSLANALNDTALIDSLGFTRQTLPAMFLPDTYEVWWDVSPKDFLLRMHREWQRFWNDERRKLASDMGFTPVEVATLASIVESETANNGEKADIAGLYINRLRRDMLLQSDPTVIFAVGDFTIRRVLHKHLTTDSPYNTYRFPGLPPGPIRIPSVVGLEAVLHYSRHDFIYMCAKEDFSGTHNFAANYSEHQKNAQRYVKALNERGIKK
ncbi:MAG: endolytic transglycosylase MltG [Bacteroidaceae bacterium]|nr:endolytic transglycosylase MltG [Bacteroidaceae bacterium]